MMLKRLFWILVLFLSFTKFSLVVSKPRPLSALQIQRAKEEGIDFTALIQELSEENSIDAVPSSRINSQRSNENGPFHRPRGKSKEKTSRNRFKDVEEDLLKAFIIPEDLQGLNLLNNLDDYVRHEDKTLNLNDINVNYALSNVKGTDFSLSPIASVNLVIINGTILVQGDADIEIKKGLHVLNVIGKENIFQVTKKVTVDGDAVSSGLFLAEAAELTFLFINDGSTTPEVFLSEDFVMNMPKNAVLRFEGEGVVRFGNGARINLNGQREANKMEEVTFSNKPSIYVSELARMTVNKDAVGTISGIGKVEISKGGKILINEPGQLIFGHEINKTPASDYPYMGLAWWNDSTSFHHDEDVKRLYFEKSSSPMLDIVVVDSGLIQVEEPSGSDSAYISLGYSKTSIDVKQGGMITIRDGGLFEINLSKNEIAEGLLSKFHFGPGGKLAIDGTGKLSMAANHYNSASVDACGYTKEFYVDWSAKDAIAQGDGKIKFVDRSGGSILDFEKDFVPSGAIYEKEEEEIEELAKSLT